VFPGRGAGRFWRGAVLAGACLITPAAAHVAGGGGVPDLGPLLFFAGLLSIACVALADRQRSLGEIAIVMVFTQPVLHVLFAMSGHSAGSIIPDQQMTIAHLVAAAVLTVLMSGAENVIFAFAALSATVLLRRVRALLQPAPGPAATSGVSYAPVTITPAHVRYLDGSAPRRGPPVVIGS
jgi:hypothetical protein